MVEERGASPAVESTVVYRVRHVNRLEVNIGIGGSKILVLSGYETRPVKGSAVMISEFIQDI